MVVFRQIADGPSMEVEGLGLTKIVLVGNELHPVAEDVNVKLTSPGPEALITPLLLIVAVETLLEVHVPASEAEA